MKMELIHMKDICDLDNGYAFKSNDYVENSNTLNCRMSNIRPDGSFDIMYNAKYLPDEYAEEYSDYILKDGDLIIAMTDMAGDPKILGVPTVVETKGYNLLLNQRVGKLRFIKEGVNADYLKLALQSKQVRSYLKRFAGGGVQLNVSKKDILNSPIQMRTEDQQEYIVNVFTKIKNTINYRKHELELLDNLIKARFVELFGKVENSKIFKLNDVCEKITAGGDRPKDTSEIKTEEYPYPVFANAATNEGLLCFSREYKIEKPCVTIAARGCTVGFTAIRCEKFTPVVRLITLVPNETVTPIYLKHYIDIKMNIEGNGAAQPQLTIPMIKSMEIMVPPIELQNEYAKFVKQTDKSKFRKQTIINAKYNERRNASGKF